MKAVLLGVSLLGVSLLGGCATSWDKYPHSLYGALRAEDTEAITAHHRLLEKIYTEAESAGKRPPAGIAAEYAYYSCKVGNPELAREALAKECEHYPESAKFVALLGRFLQLDNKEENHGNP